MATFSNSTFWYDKVAWWQMFSFLTDLEPVYAIWILESRRAGNAWTPAFIPTLFISAARLLGIGLCERWLGAERSATSRPRINRVLAFDHPCVPHVRGFRRVPRPGLNDEALLDLGMATDPRLDRRQQSPAEQTCQPAFAQVCSGCARSYFNRGLGLHFIVYTVLSVDYFHPGSRSAFISSFLWLAYSFLDLSIAGLSDPVIWLLNIALLPAVIAIARPDMAFAFGWYLGEKALSSAKN
ncbi:hypothetical protein F4806DRAFT_498913 [Annulohypoxylon nitens]|nr:hypothetical protein F4806DRAFT_498913 [Annulohypoxylon nitens]